MSRNIMIEYRLLRNSDKKHWLICMGLRMTWVSQIIVWWKVLKTKV